MSYIQKPTTRTDALQVDAAGTADPVITLTIDNTAEWYVGVDNSDSDKFQIGRGSAPGTNVHLSSTEAGEITTPLQPAALATRTTTADNVTGDGTEYTIVFNNELYDNNADYDASTGTFTAPVTGRYLINVRCAVHDIAAGHDRGYVQIVTSNATYRSRFHPANVADSSGWLQMDSTVLTDMDAADTVTISCTIFSATKVIDITLGADTSLQIELQG